MISCDVVSRMGSWNRKRILSKKKLRKSEDIGILVHDNVPDWFINCDKCTY